MSAAPRVSAAPIPKLVPAPGVVIAGKYQLDHPLRRGAMGSVWVALHRDLDMRVAVKLMVIDLEDTTGSAGTGEREAVVRARFEREAKVVAQLRSPNIVRVLDYGVDRGVPYMVMELLEGEDLLARLGRVGRLPPPEVARILVPVAKALQRAHDAGLIHRDLKPGNIFLAKEGDEEVPKILDFGVAKAMHRDEIAGEVTVDGLVVGTPAYMSPEQATGRRDVDRRADLWSLGVIAFMAMTGRKPFGGSSTIDMVVHICSGPIPRPSDIVSDLPPELDALIAGALVRDRDERFQSAKEIARALTPFLPRSSSLPPVPEGTGSSGVRPLNELDPNAEISAGEPVPVSEQAARIAEPTEAEPSEEVSGGALPRPRRRGRARWVAAGALTTAAAVAVAAAVRAARLRSARPPAHAGPSASAATGPALEGPAATSAARSAQGAAGSATAVALRFPGGDPGADPRTTGAATAPATAAPADSGRPAEKRAEAGAKPVSVGPVVPAGTKKGKRDLGY